MKIYHTVFFIRVLTFFIIAPKIHHFLSQFSLPELRKRLACDVSIPEAERQ